MSYLAFKYKLKPTKEQAEILSQYAGSCRYIWNYFLGQNKEQYQLDKKFVFKYQTIPQLPKLKQELIWLADVPSQALQQKLLDLDTAIHRCYKSKFGFPKFKKKSDNSDSFRLVQSNGNNPHIKPSKKQIKIPKLGWIKWIKHRELQGKLKSITIKQEGDGWYCVCLCEQTTVIEQKALDKNKLVGIDLGLIDFAVCSDGNVIDTPKLYRKKQKKLKRVQRKLSKATKGSKNREK